MTKPKAKALVPVVADLSTLETYFSTHVRGQMPVVQRLAREIQRRELQAVPQPGARGGFIFAGPTGVGKTQLALTLANGLFGPERLVRFDCSEFKTLAAYEGLFGNRAGDAGRLAQAFARVPAGVWLFDEIEKAHPDLVHLFLQGVGDGVLTNAAGESLSLKSIYVIVTTNLGAGAVAGREHLPFSSIERHVIRAVESWLRPELRARFSRPYVFQPLSRQAQLEITEGYVRRIVEMNATKGRLLTVDPGVISYLACRGYSRRLGARTLHQFVDEQVGDAIAGWVMRGGGGNARLAVVADHVEVVV